MIILWITLFLLINALIGMIVLDSIDHVDQRLFKWYCQRPDRTGIVQLITLELWPIVALIYLWRNGE